ncbi:MAG: hypothetical protein LBU32_18560 [Clostridiales bacterium]|nr:hypothetical protein [Clostridiales bacterium]
MKIGETVDSRTKTLHIRYGKKTIFEIANDGLNLVSPASNETEDAYIPLL